MTHPDSIIDKSCVIRESNPGLPLLKVGVLPLHQRHFLPLGNNFVLDVMTGIATVIYKKLRFKGTSKPILKTTCPAKGNPVAAGQSFFSVAILGVPGFEPQHPHCRHKTTRRRRPRSRGPWRKTRNDVAFSNLVVQWKEQLDVNRPRLKKVSGLKCQYVLSNGMQ